MRFRLTLPAGNDASLTAHRLAGATVIALLDGSAIVDLGLDGDGGGHLTADCRLGASDLEAFSDGADVIRIAKEAAEIRYCFGTPGPGRVSPLPDAVRSLFPGGGESGGEADWTAIWTLINDPVCGCAIVELATDLLVAGSLEGQFATDLVRQTLQTESAIAEMAERDFR